MANTRKIPKPLKVGKTDTYSLTVASEWLGAEVITGVTVTTDNTKIAVGLDTVVGNVIYVFLTGVEAGQSVEVHFNYETATRSDCDYILINVEDC